MPGSQAASPLRRLEEQDAYFSISWVPGFMGFPSSSEGKAFACNAGDSGLIPGLGRSPGEGNGN